MEEKDVLPYLERMISWHRAAATLDTSPELPRELINRPTRSSTPRRRSTAALLLRVRWRRCCHRRRHPPSFRTSPTKPAHAITLNRAIGLAEQDIDDLQVALAAATTRADQNKLGGELETLAGTPDAAQGGGRNDRRSRFGR